MANVNLVRSSGQSMEKRSIGPPQRTNDEIKDVEDMDKDDRVMLVGKERSDGETPFLKGKTSSRFSLAKSSGKSPGKSPKVNRSRKDDPQQSHPEGGCELQPLKLSDPSPAIPTASPTKSEEQGRNPNESTGICLGRRIYGRESVWHHILFGPTEENRQDHPKSDIVCALGLIGTLVFAWVIISQSQGTWPQVPHTYYTDSYADNVRGGLSYTCGCILPPSLQSPENPTDQVNLNVCYEPSSLETVTILVYSNSTAEAPIRQIINETSPKIPLHRIIENGGWNVIQDAHELTVQTETFFNLPDVASLYPGGEQLPIAYVPVQDLQGSTFPGDFPGAYIQMYWIYDCNDCNTCSLEAVNSLAREVANESWVSCYYYGYNSTRCEIDNTYTAKCVLYPSNTLPVQLAVQLFLTKFYNTSGISNVRSPLTVNNTVLQPDVLYLNSSTVTESQIRLGFLEIQRDSVLWAMLYNAFPTLETECKLLQKVRVCNNGTSVCNLFSTADLTCYDYTESSQCESIRGLVTPDNEHLNTLFADVLCPQNIACQLEFPYLVTWNISESGENDALNSFLASSILKGEWERRSGVCTKTYKTVIREPAKTVDGNSDDSDTKFLESQCSYATASQPTFCWLTGNYHNLTDMPDDDWTRLPDDLFFNNSNLFACYRMERQKWLVRFINNFGVLFGWFGTIVLVFYGLFSVWIIVRDKTISFFSRISVSVWDRITMAFVSVKDRSGVSSAPTVEGASANQDTSEDPSEGSVRKSKLPTFDEKSN